MAPYVGPQHSETRPKRRQLKGLKGHLYPGLREGVKDPLSKGKALLDMLPLVAEPHLKFESHVVVVELGDNNPRGRLLEIVWITGHQVEQDMPDPVKVLVDPHGDRNIESQVGKVGIGSDRLVDHLRIGDGQHFAIAGDRPNRDHW